MRFNGFDTISSDSCWIVIKLQTGQNLLTLILKAFPRQFWIKFGSFGLSPAFSAEFTFIVK